MPRVTHKGSSAQRSGRGVGLTEQTGVSGVGFANCAWGKETVYFTFLKLQYNLLHFLRGMKKGNPKGPWRVEGVLVVKTLPQGCRSSTGLAVIMSVPLPQPLLPPGLWYMPQPPTLSGWWARPQISFCCL